MPVPVSIYEDRIVIFNGGSWSKRVPMDERVYEKHGSVPRNTKIVDVSFRSEDVEALGRGFVKIKAECKTIDAPLSLTERTRTRALLKMLVADEKISETGATKMKRYLVINGNHIKS